MINRIMTLRVAAVAMAASALFALPAAADRADRIDNHQVYGGKTAPHARDIGHKDPYRGDTAYGMTDPYGDPYRARNRALERNALRQCRAAIRQKARYLGYRDIDFERKRDVRRVGPAGYNIVFYDVEVEDRYRQVEGDVYCTIRRGDVVSIDVDTHQTRYSHNRHAYRPVYHAYR